MNELKEILYQLIKNNTLPFLFIGLPFTSKLVYTYIFVKVFNKEEDSILKTYNKLINKETNDSFKVKALLKSKDENDNNHLTILTSINRNDLTFYLTNINKFKDILLQFLVYVGNILNEIMLIAKEEEILMFKALNLKTENIFKFNFKIIFPFERLTKEEQELFNDVFETFDKRNFNIDIEGVY